MITRDSWLQAIAEAESAHRPPDDPSLVTTTEFCELLGVCRATGERRLRALLRAGKVTRETKLLTRINGAVTLVAAYRLVEPADGRPDPASNHAATRDGLQRGVSRDAARGVLRKRARRHRAG